MNCKQVLSATMECSSNTATVVRAVLKHFFLPNEPNRNNVKSCSGCISLVKYFQMETNECLKTENRRKQHLRKSHDESSGHSAGLLEGNNIYDRVMMSLVVTALAF